MSTPCAKTEAVNRARVNKDFNMMDVLNKMRRRWEGC